MLSRPFSRSRRRPLFVLALALATIPSSALRAADDAAIGMPEPEHAETRELLDLVRAAVARVEAEGVDGACAEFRREGSRWLAGSTYVFVFDLEGNALCHPARPSLEGRSLLELRDPHGKPIVRSFLRELERGDDGWVHYHWPRPGGQTFYWKSTYIHRAATPDGKGVMVGSGLYQMKMEPFFVVEQVEDAAALIEARGEAAFEVLRDRTSGYRFLDAYVFVLDWEGNQLVNAGFPELEGTNTIDLTDAEGRVIGREMIALLEKQQSGWVDYLWPRPGDRKPARKSAYVRRVELDGKKLLIGAGIYR